MFTLISTLFPIFKISLSSLSFPQLFILCLHFFIFFSIHSHFLMFPGPHSHWIDFPLHYCIYAWIPYKNVFKPVLIICSSLFLDLIPGWVKCPYQQVMQTHPLSKRETVALPIWEELPGCAGAVPHAADVTHSRQIERIKSINCFQQTFALDVEERPGDQFLSHESK